MANLKHLHVDGDLIEDKGATPVKGVDTSTSTVIIGTDTAFYNDSGNPANAAVLTASTYTTAGKTVIAYYEGGLPNNVYGINPRAIVVTVNGNSIQYGAAGQNETQYPVVADSGNDAEDGISIGYEQTENKILLCYGTNGNHQHTMVVGTVSGTTTTWGTATDFESGSTPNDDSLRHNSMVWVGGIGSDTCNRLVLVYQDQNNDGAGRVMTISGTTPTAHAVAEWTASQPYDHCVAYIGSGAVVVAYNTLGNGDAKVGTVSGGGINTIVWANNTRFSTGLALQANKLAIANDGTAFYFVIAYVDGVGAAQKGYVEVGFVSGTTISFPGTPVVFDGVQGTDAVSLVYHTASSRFLVSYRPGGGNNITSRSFKRTGTNITNLGSATALPNSDSSTNLDHTCSNYDPLNKRVLVFRNKGNEKGAWGIPVDLLVSTVTVDLSGGNFFELDLEPATANITNLTITETLSGVQVKTFTLKITQGTIVKKFIWSSISNVKWPGGTGPLLTQTNNAIDILQFTTYDAGTTWYGEIIGLSMGLV